LKLTFHDLHPTPADLAAEVLAGLNRRPRAIPPKFFYDARGSALFEAITETPEYYLTRTELAILRAHAADIAARVGSGSLIVEPGGGSCAKVRILLEGLRPCAYVPMDISREHLRLAAEQVAAQFPWLEVHAACADFTRTLAMPVCLARRAARGLLPRLQHRQFRSRGRRLIHGGGGGAGRGRRLPAHRRRSQEGPGRAGGGL